MLKKRCDRKKITVLPVVLLLIMLCAFYVKSAALGESGQEVRRVQEQLSVLGYFGGKKDGLFSPELANAVRSFQSAKELPSSGKVDSRTLGLLFDDLPPEDTTQKLLAKYIAAKSAGKPYWEQMACGTELLDKLQKPESPNTLAGLLMRESGAARMILQTVPDSTARQAATDCLNGKR
ncbi:MAG: peptidoglycan-binding protein [Oscillospiraceae bacterium]|nr:peptidoglycan-binding protein [Oscillospiraceae bacterium]